MTRTLAIELAKYNIRVNAVCPGFVQTPLLQSWQETLEDRDAVMAQVLANHPLGRIGTIHDVGDAANDGVEDLAEVEGGGEGLGELEHHLGVALLVREGVDLAVEPVVGADAGDELRVVEGAAEEVVGPGLEHGLDEGLVGVVGDGEERLVARAGVAAQPAHQGQRALRLLPLDDQQEVAAEVELRVLVVRRAGERRHPGPLQRSREVRSGVDIVRQHQDAARHGATVSGVLATR